MANEWRPTGPDSTIYPTATAGRLATTESTIYTGSVEEAEAAVAKQPYSKLSIAFFILLLLTFFVTPIFFLPVVIVGTILGFRSTSKSIRSVNPLTNGPKRAILLLFRVILCIAGGIALLIVGLIAFLIIGVYTGAVDFRVGS